MVEEKADRIDLVVAQELHVPAHLVLIEPQRRTHARLAAVPIHTLDVHLFALRIQKAIAARLKVEMTPLVAKRRHHAAGRVCRRLLFELGLQLEYRRWWRWRRWLRRWRRRRAWMQKLGGRDRELKADMASVEEVAWYLAAGTHREPDVPPMASSSFTGLRAHLRHPLRSLRAV